jgi:protein TonB
MEIKKYPEHDLENYHQLFLNIGLIVALTAVIIAFEWRTYDRGAGMDLGVIEDNFEDLLEIPPTEQPPPPPPVIQQPEIIEVPDEEEIEEEIEIELDVEFEEELVVEELIFEEPEEEVEEIFTIVEDQPEFPGGIGAFYKYVATNLRYPAQARRMGIAGKVFVQFVVEKDGRLTDVQILKGIGAGCDEEALRVIKKSKAWKPGRQRGRPVKVRMIIPINFRLG